MLVVLLVQPSIDLSFRLGIFNTPLRSDIDLGHPLFIDREDDP
jgi:hypothetical protein